MRLPPRPWHRPREPIGPLVDIVFLLLIFFLLAGTLEPVLPLAVAPPHATRPGVPLDGPIRVQLAADGRLGLDGQVVSDAALATAIGARLAGTEPPPAVQVEADGDASSGAVLDLLGRLRTAGAERLALVTIAESPRADD
ncbi:biopolymer transport protein [Thioflavicoccus mobilis 8321]|uniref:Biopolymer transport protein n=1 Tax=Thioflavicoccus mobilis 8321 TaxID=765912 RepID=L0GXN4_9GAMM|nr:biopolymer transporter ExbD [Thioflavicoccus mobilis]AGA91508.1 biopolymer transport protein [Thioflavicoccus mobilis 8321]